MNDVEKKQVVIDIPHMNGLTGEGIVKVALDKSPGVIEYETSLRTRQVSVTFDPNQVTEETLIGNIKKITRYTDVRIKQ